MTEDQLACQTSPSNVSAELPVTIKYGDQERRLEGFLFRYTLDPNITFAEKGSIVLCLALCWQPVNLFPYFPKFNAENPAGLWGRLGPVHSQHMGRLWSYMRQGRSPSRTLISLGCPVSSFEPRRVRHVPPALGPWVGTMDFSSGF